MRTGSLARVQGCLVGRVRMHVCAGLRPSLREHTKPREHGYKGTDTKDCSIPSRMRGSYIFHLHSYYIQISGYTRSYKLIHHNSLPHTYYNATSNARIRYHSLIDSFIRAFLPIYLFLSIISTSPPGYGTFSAYLPMSRIFSWLRRQPFEVFHRHHNLLMIVFVTK
jgi:hypothetical protein